MNRREALFGGASLAALGVSAQAGSLALLGAGGAGSSSPVDGDAIAVTIMGADLVDAGRNVPVNAWIAAVKFKGMAAQSVGSVSGGAFVPVSGFDPSSLEIVVRDESYDVATDAYVWKTRTLNGTIALNRPYPLALVNGAPETIAAGDFRSYGATNTKHMYFALTGGSWDGTPPSHTSGTTAAGGVSWTWVDPDVFTGYFQTVDGDDIIQYAALNGQVYADTEIVSASIGAGAYDDGAATSNATASIGSLTNSSTRAYWSPQVAVLSKSHRRSTGTLHVELKVASTVARYATAARLVAAVKFTAWNAARTTSSTTIICTSPSLSTEHTTSSPGGCAVEVFAADLDTSGIAAGEAFWEYEVIPWLGTETFNSRYDGEAADWQASTDYLLNQVIRNGANLYICDQPGTSASSGGPTGTGTDIADGTARWDYFGADLTKQNSRNPQARVHFLSDPSNLYAKGYANYISTGTATGTAGVFASLALAKAQKADNSKCYASPKLAADALKTYHNGLGGGAIQHNDAGGGVIVCYDHVVGFGASMGSLTLGSEWLYMIPDPDASAFTIEFQLGSNKVPYRRMWIEDFKMVMGASNSLIDPGGADGASLGQPNTELHLEHCDITGYSASDPPLNRVGLYTYSNCIIRDYFVCGNDNSRPHAALIAGCDFDLDAGTVRSANLIGNKITGLSVVKDCRTNFQPAMMFYVGADNRCFTPNGLSPSGSCMVDICGGSSGFANPYKGAAWTGNLIEVANDTGGNKCIQMGADGSINDLDNVTFAFNSHVGDRNNLAYNDQNTTYPYRRGWLIMGNILAELNKITDANTHTTYKNGIKCFNWEPVFCVDDLQNVVFNGGLQLRSTGNGRRIGEGSVWTTAVPAYPGEFIDDASDFGDGSGFGDYHPNETTGSALDLMAVQAAKYALDGQARKTDGTGAAGAFERD